MVRREKARGFWMIDFWWEYPDGKKERFRYKSPIQTKKGAEAQERKRKEELSAGTYGKTQPGEIPTLKEFVPRLMSYAKTNDKPSSVESKRYITAVHLIPELGDVRLDKINTKEIQDFKERQLEKELSKKSINNQLAVLRKLLDIACEEKLIAFVPQVKWLKVPKADFDFLTFEEAPRLLKAASVKWYAMIATALLTGLRLGELLALRWGDVDLVAGRLVCKRSNWRGLLGGTKSHRSREIPLNDDLIRILKALRAETWLKGDLVFGAMAYEAPREPLRTACKKAGLREIGWHTLRHTFASHLVMKGCPLKTVQELLGHASIEMTMRYAHLSPDVKRDAVGLLSLNREKKEAKSVGSLNS